MERCIYELTFEHLKANRNIHRNSNLIWVSYNILVSRWLMKSPNCILKRVSLRQIFYMPKGNDVKTLSMEFYWPISLRYIDVLK